MLKRHSELVPSIATNVEEPDRYAFVWSDEPDDLQPRFFRLKDVIQAVAPQQETEPKVCGDVFVGGYGPDSCPEPPWYRSGMAPLRFVGVPPEVIFDEILNSFCVGVRKETSGTLQVVYVESMHGLLDEDWVKGISKQLNAKAECTLSWDALREDVKRETLTTLRNVLEKHTLKIPNKYPDITEELLDFSYKTPSKGFVQALALAVTAACKT